MVRYARVKGSHSKSSFNKVPEEASTWNELTQKANEGDLPSDGEPGDTSGGKPMDVEKVESSWCDFEPEKSAPKKKKRDKQRKNAAPEDGFGVETTDEPKKKLEVSKKKSRLQKETEGLEFKRRKLETDVNTLNVDGVDIKLAHFDGYVVTQEDAERLENLRKKLRKDGEDEKRIYATVKMERRKAERFVKLKKKTLCFHCRKGGHNLSDCPELSKTDVTTQPGGLCFKCGSTEHRLPQCRSKSSTLEFATCFICSETGHLSKSCPNNPRGLYPDGGCCRTCKDVTHYERDCPKLVGKNARGRQNTAKTLLKDNVEALDYEDEFRPKKVKIDTNKKGPNKIIKF